ncbi:outer membrane beta-barrel protein [Methylocystis sp. IM3]|uniref:outer membrane protein n=1 Tax=unclassified Methylocystis TaxID=2625913 RepID=UPI0030F6955A
MFPQFPRARAAFLAALLSVSAQTARAADLFDLPEAPELPEGPVEWGSNWYLRGDVGFQEVRLPALSGAFQALGRQDIISGGLGGGYQFNDWLRADVTIDRSVFRKTRMTGQFWCPTELRGLVDQATGFNVGIYADPNSICSQYSSASLNRTSVLANAYFDIAHVWGFTPYIGAGVGMTYNSGSSSVAYLRNSDSGLWAPNLTLPEGQVPLWIYADGAPFPIQLPFAQTNWNFTQTKSSWQFAWNLMAGVSYDLSRNFKVDVGYRYLNAGKYTGLPAYAANGVYIAPQTRDITSHELRVGFRITTN